VPGLVQIALTNGYTAGVVVRSQLVGNPAISVTEMHQEQEGE